MEVGMFRRRALRWLGWTIGIFASILAVLILVVAAYLLFWDYPEKIRQALQRELEKLSGAPAVVESVSLDVPRYGFELRGVEIRSPHRPEPILELQRVRGRLRLSSLLNLELRWSELEFDGMTISLSEEPREANPLDRPSRMAQLAQFTLASDRIAITNARFLLHDDEFPWSLDASNASLLLRRVRAQEYEGQFTYKNGLFRIKDLNDIQASVEADFQIVLNELFLRKGTVSFPFAQLEATGKVGFVGGLRGRFDLLAEGEPGRIAAHLAQAEEVSRVVEGKASFRGTLAVEPESKILQGTFVLPEGALAGLPLREWKGELHWDPSLLSVGRASGRLASGRAGLQLHQPLPLADHPGTVTLDLESASLERMVMERSGRSLPIDSLVSGSGTFSFPGETPTAFEGSFAVEGKPAGVEDRTPLSFQARGSIGAERLDIEDLRAETPFLSATLSGEYPREGPASLWMDLTTTDLAAADALNRELRRVFVSESDRPPELWGFEGKAVLAGWIRERLPRLVFDGELSAEDLRLANFRLGHTRARTLFSPGAITFRDLETRLDNGILSGNGSLSLVGPVSTRDFEVDVDVSSWPLSEIRAVVDLPRELSGTFSGSVTASRREGRLEGKARVELAPFAVSGLGFSGGKARIVLDGSRLVLDPVSLSRESAAVQGRLELDTISRDLGGRLSAREIPLASLIGAESAVSGTLAADLELSGTYENPSGELKARGTGIELSGLALSDARLEGRLEGKDLDVDVELKGQSSEIAFNSSVRLEGDYLSRGRLEWSGLDAAPWLGFFPAEESRLSVTSSGEADYRVPLRTANPLKAAELEAQVASLVLEGPGYRVASVTPPRMFLHEGRLELSRTAFAEEQSRLFLGGSLDLTEKTLDVAAEGVVSLGIFQTFYPQIATSGETTLSARVTGTLERPSIEGYADFDGGSIRLGGFRQALGGLKGRVVFDNRTVQIPRLEAVFGSGPIVLDGTIALEGLKPGSVDLRAQGSGVRLRYPEGLVATLEGEVSLLGRPSERMVSGSLVLSDAVWSREYDLVSGILADRDDRALFEALVDDETYRDLRLDVRIRIPGSLEVRNSLARVDASAELELRGTLGEPVLLGRAESRRGEIYFLGQRYEITSGKVDFVNPERIEPFVDLTAETRVRSYQVELRLTGTPDRFFPELSSDPPLRTVDILRLLAGASDRELLDALVGNETEELAGVGVASLLTERLSQEVGKRAERLFGLDRFSVNPFLVGQFANPTARVSLGKQITRELSINYSTNLNAATEAFILIEYTPQGPMSWILSRDEEGDVGIDVKFRKSF
jgi:hypothetical protein